MNIGIQDAVLKLVFNSREHEIHNDLSFSPEKMKIRNF